MFLSRARARSATAKLTLVLLSTTATVVGVDVALRLSNLVAPRRGVLSPTPARQALTDWIDVFPAGYSGTLTSRDFKVSVRGNPLGLRERNLDFAALSTEHPYLFLGDSYFFGWGVEQEQRVSEVFAAGMAKAARAAPVVNFSFPGWGNYHYLAVWERFVPRLRPRLVIVSCFVGNDFTDDLTQQVLRQERAEAGRGDGSAGLFFRPKRAAREILSTSPVLSLVRQALWLSPAFRRSFNALEIRNDRIALYDAASTDVQRQLYGATESALASMARLSRADGIPLLVVLIPDHLQVLMPDLFHGHDFDKPQRTMQAFFKEQGINGFDLLPLFRGVPAPEELFFHEDKHWNPRGHAFVAEALSLRVSELEGRAAGLKP